MTAIASMTNGMELPSLNNMMDTEHTKLITSGSGCSLPKGHDLYPPAKQARRVDLIYLIYLVYLVSWFVWLIVFFEPNQPTEP